MFAARKFCDDIRDTLCEMYSKNMGPLMAVTKMALMKKMCWTEGKLRLVSKKGCHRLQNNVFSHSLPLSFCLSTAPDIISEIERCWSSPRWCVPVGAPS